MKGVVMLIGFFGSGGEDGRYGNFATDAIW